MNTTRRYIPFAAFLVILGVLAFGLRLKPNDIPSALIGKPAPAFKLPTLAGPVDSLSGQDMLGKVWILNVWASWCVACRQEHASMIELAKTGVVPIYGLNYKDKREDALGWLDQFGNPYAASLSDVQGVVGIDYGVYGVPETFVIDKAGVIRHKFTGPVTPEAIRGVVLPLVRKLNG